MRCLRLQRLTTAATASAATCASAARCHLSSNTTGLSIASSKSSSPYRTQRSRLASSSPLPSTSSSQLVPPFVGSGAASPGLLCPTRVARIPPQLAQLLIAGGAALLQVFLVAFQRESRRIKTESAATGTAEGIGAKRHMSGVEAVQVLGLDRSYPALFNEVQKAESVAASSGSVSSSALLPLKDRKATEEARRNFERMFALAKREENLFLAGKLSAAYRVCVDPMWDQVDEVEENHKKQNDTSEP